MLSKIYVLIITLFIISAINIDTTFSNSDLPVNIKNETISDSKSERSSEITCKGEYRYCGGGVYKCIQDDGGLFACCDTPEHCPRDIK